MSGSGNNGSGPYIPLGDGLYNVDGMGIEVVRVGDIVVEAAPTNLYQPNGKYAGLAQRGTKRDRIDESAASQLDLIKDKAVRAWNNFFGVKNISRKKDYLLEAKRLYEELVRATANVGNKEFLDAIKELEDVHREMVILGLPLGHESEPERSVVTPAAPRKRVVPKSAVPPLPRRIGTPKSVPVSVSAPAAAASPSVFSFDLDLSTPFSVSPSKVTKTTKPAALKKAKMGDDDDRVNGVDNDSDEDIAFDRKEAVRLGLAAFLESSIQDLKYPKDNADLEALGQLLWNLYSSFTSNAGIDALTGESLTPSVVLQALERSSCCYQELVARGVKKPNDGGVVDVKKTLEEFRAKHSPLVTTPVMVFPPIKINVKALEASAEQSFLDYQTMMQAPRGTWAYNQRYTQGAEHLKQAIENYQHLLSVMPKDNQSELNRIQSRVTELEAMLTSHLESGVAVIPELLPTRSRPRVGVEGTRLGEEEEADTLSAKHVMTMVKANLDDVMLTSHHRLAFAVPKAREKLNLYQSTKAFFDRHKNKLTPGQQKEVEGWFELASAAIPGGKSRLQSPINIASPRLSPAASRAATPSAVDTWIAKWKGVTGPVLVEGNQEVLKEFAHFLPRIGSRTKRPVSLSMEKQTELASAMSSLMSLLLTEPVSNAELEEIRFKILFEGCRLYASLSKHEKGIHFFDHPESGAFLFSYIARKEVFPSSSSSLAADELACIANYQDKALENAIICFSNLSHASANHQKILGDMGLIEVLQRIYRDKETAQSLKSLILGTLQNMTSNCVSNQSHAKQLISDLIETALRATETEGDRVAALNVLSNIFLNHIENQNHFMSDAVGENLRKSLTELLGGGSTPIAQAAAAVIIHSAYYKKDESQARFTALNLIKHVEGYWSTQSEMLSGDEKKSIQDGLDCLKNDMAPPPAVLVPTEKELEFLDDFLGSSDDWEAFVNPAQNAGTGSSAAAAANIPGLASLPIKLASGWVDPMFLSPMASGGAGQSAGVVSLVSASPSPDVFEKAVPTPPLGAVLATVPPSSDDESLDKMLNQLADRLASLTDEVESSSIWLKDTSRVNKAHDLISAIQAAIPNLTLLNGVRKEGWSLFKSLQSLFYLATGESIKKNGVGRGLKAGLQESLFGLFFELNSHLDDKSKFLEDHIFAGTAEALCRLTPLYDIGNLSKVTSALKWMNSLVDLRQAHGKNCSNSFLTDALENLARPGAKVLPEEQAQWVRNLRQKLGQPVVAKPALLLHSHLPQLSRFSGGGASPATSSGPK